MQQSYPPPTALCFPSLPPSDALFSTVSLPLVQKNHPQRAWEDRTEWTLTLDPWTAGDLHGPLQLRISAHFCTNTQVRVAH